MKPSEMPRRVAPRRVVGLEAAQRLLQEAEGGCVVSWGVSCISIAYRGREVVLPINDETIQLIRENA